MAPLTTNGHQHVIDKNFINPDYIVDTIKYYKYNNKNELFFIELDLGMV